MVQLIFSVDKSRMEMLRMEDSKNKTLKERDCFLVKNYSNYWQCMDN